MPTRVCVVGTGGREHALAAALARTARVVVTPGNPGMEALGIECTAAPATALDADLFVIGPEAPLVDGLADRLRAQGLLVFGPGADGARLEGSKGWMKEVLRDAGVPTAAYATFDSAQVGEAVDYLRSLPGPWVVKTDGLAAGKGVLVTEDRDVAERDVAAKLGGRSAFGEAGRRVVIEEGLVGPELSVMAVCDGRRAVSLAAAQDFKRALDADAGPNTGGMGAYSPVPFAGADLVQEVMTRAVAPTLDAMRARGIDFRGVLYAGLMLTSDGPRVLEFNVRFGDPETQVVVPRWEGDVAALLEAAARGSLSDVAPPTFTTDAAVGVVLASAGYPGQARSGDPIEGLTTSTEGVDIYAAGVASAGGRLVTAGGRVVTVVGRGASLRAARDLAYEVVPRVSWEGVQYRTDIAAAAVSTDERVEVR
jgi:phosphoribosylamine--glycine ligase